MNFRFPIISLLTIALLLSPSLLQIGITQTAQTPDSSQPTQLTGDRATQVEADRMYEQGLQQSQTNRSQAALHFYQQALSLYQEIGDRAGEATALSSIGYLYKKTGQYSQALEFYQQALAIFRGSGDQVREGIMLNNIGVVYNELDQYPQALEYFQQALTIYEVLGNRVEQGTTLNNIGLAYQSLGQYPQALENFQQALQIAREIDNQAGEGNSLDYIGRVYHSLGQYSEALKSFQQSLVIRREIDDRLGIGAVLIGIGQVHEGLGQYPQALETFQQAVQIAREVGDRLGEGDSLNQIGLIYHSLGQYSEALESFQQSLVIRREIDDRLGIGAVLNNIGLAYQSLGQYSQSLEFFQQGLEIAREGNYRVGEEAALANIGFTYYRLGQYSQAESFLKQALEIARQIGDRAGEVAALNRIGLVYDDLGQYQQALDQYRQALTILEEVGDRASVGQILNNIGIAYWSQGQNLQALNQYQQALVIQRGVSDRSGEGYTLNNIGAALLSSGQFAAATETLFQAIEVQESLRAPELSDASKIALIDIQNTAYHFLQQALIAQNEIETALEVAERARARVFVELLAQHSSLTASNQSLDISAPTIAQIIQVAREQNATLVEYSITYETVRIEGRIEWQQSKLYIWVVKPTGEVAFRQVDLTANNATLSAMVRQGRQSINARGRGSASSPPQTEEQPRQPQRPFPYLQELYQVLIEPIADLLPTNPEDHVVFIPQGELFLVPFPALQDANGRYLIENHTIMTAPSIQVLSLTRRSQQTPSIDSSQALIVGNPTMPMIPAIPPNPPRQLSALPESGREAIAIAEQFNTQPLLGDAATETVVVQRMTSAPIIHLATHGMLEYGDPQASGVRDFPGAIALAPFAQDDGLLTSSEIFNLKLNADLVVLSACDTGLGRMSADGMIGLSRSLLSAGAASVIVSLWKVNDGTTNMLMTEFYQQLEQQPDKAQALRQAMLETMQEYRNPGAWAAFTLIGESE